MKMRSLFGIICACIISFSLCGCANESEEIKSESVETVESVAETVDAEILNMETEEVYQTDDISEMDETKTDNETIEEAENLLFESALDWAIYVDAEEPQLTIWNSRSKQGDILENGQEYNIRENDYLVICGNLEGSVATEIKGIDLNEILSTTIHSEYGFYAEDINTKVKILLETNKKEELELLLTCEKITNSPDASQEEILSGKEWAATLKFDEPKLLVWNDETGTREVIDEGGEYHMQEGDVLAAYYGDIEKCILVRVEPFDFCPELTFFGNCDRMEYVLPEESQTINLGLEFCDFSRNEFFTYYFTITTP